MTEDNVIDDPDCKFLDDEEDSEDEPVVSSSDESQGMQQSSSTERTWTSKDGNIKWLKSPPQSRGRYLQMSSKLLPVLQDLLSHELMIFNQPFSSSYPYQ